MLKKIRELVPFSFGVITDEIHSDPNIALPIAAEMGFEFVEFNTVDEKGIHELTDQEAADLAELVASNGLKTCTLSPPCFKIVELDEIESGKVGEDEIFQTHLGWLKRTCDLTPVFGARNIRIFSFRRSDMGAMGNPSPRHPGGGSVPDEILSKAAEGLRLSLPWAESAGVRYLLENVRSCWGNSGINTARILNEVSDPRLRTIWDPGNDFVSGGVPYPEGYGAVKPYIEEVHVKDAVVEDTETGFTKWECIGQGEVDYSGQVGALVDDRFEGVVCVETHWRELNVSRAECTRRTTAGLLRCLEEGICRS